MLEAQLTRYRDLPRDIEALGRRFDPDREARVTRDGKVVWNGDQAAIGFGKYNGHALRSVAKKDSGYLRWMLGGEFPAETKAVIRAALAGEFPRRRRP